MTGLILREYQSEAVDAVFDDWDAGITPVAVVLPTGSGKTVIFSAITKRFLNMPATIGRVLILVDRNELVEQTYRTILALVPGVTVGVVKAERDEVDAQVIIASIQTLRQPHRMQRLTNVGAIIVDECDLAMAEGYLAILEHYGALSRIEDGPRGDLEPIPCVGVTATLERTDGRGFGDLFAKVSYTRDILWMIRHGYLCDVRGLTPANVGIDLSGVRRSRMTRDYDEHDLGAVMEDEKVALAIADAYLEHAAGRRAVHFAPTVASAYAQAEAYTKAGVTAEVITGETPLDVRAGIYHRLRTGETSMVVNCMVLTRGWDAPWVEVAVMGRPTQSKSLYIQCVGRVLRTWQGKPGALVLDVAGIAKVAKLVTLIDLSVVTPKEGETLLEAEEREMSEDLAEDDGWGQGETARKRRGVKFEKDGGLVEINLFAASSTAWLQTRKGVWFISTRRVVWLIWEFDDGTYGVATYDNTSYASRPVMGPTGLDMTLAMAIAEQAATEADRSLASRGASWRKGNIPATQLQRDALERYHVPFDYGITKNQASDAISVAKASLRVDPWVSTPAPVKA